MGAPDGTKFKQVCAARCNAVLSTSRFPQLTRVMMPHECAGPMAGGRYPLYELSRMGQILFTPPAASDRFETIVQDAVVSTAGAAPLMTARRILSNRACATFIGQLLQDPRATPSARAPLDAAGAELCGHIRSTIPRIYRFVFRGRRPAWLPATPYWGAHLPCLLHGMLRGLGPGR